MLNRNVFSVFLTIFVAYSTASRKSIVDSYYEETLTYSDNPKCKPSTLDKGIKCSSVGSPILMEDGINKMRGMFYIPLASAYYVARIADAMGYQDRCPANKTFLEQLDMVAAWSGKYGPISIDLACGFEKQTIRRCSVPFGRYPYLCTGVEGPPGTYGKRLETVSYITVVARERWALFINCWRAKTPTNPKSEEIATSFNVFSLDPELSAADRALVIGELNRLGFNTHRSNIIKFDYSANSCK